MTSALERVKASVSLARSSRPSQEPVKELGGKHDLLFRLFESEFFDGFMCLQYLYQNPQPAVEDYLCNKLVALPESAIERYLLQFVYLAVSRPGSVLERTIVSLCTRSFVLAVKVHWLLLALGQDTPKPKNVDALRDKCEKAALGGQWELPFNTSLPVCTPEQHPAGDHSMLPSASHLQRLEQYPSSAQVDQRVVYLSDDPTAAPPFPWPAPSQTLLTSMPLSDMDELAVCSEPGHHQTQLYSSLVCRPGSALSHTSAGQEAACCKRDHGSSAAQTKGWPEAQPVNSSPISCLGSEGPPLLLAHCSSCREWGPGPAAQHSRSHSEAALHDWPPPATSQPAKQPCSSMPLTTNQALAGGGGEQGGAPSPSPGHDRLPHIHQGTDQLTVTGHWGVAPAAQHMLCAAADSACFLMGLAQGGSNTGTTAMPLPAIKAGGCAALAQACPPAPQPGCAQPQPTGQGAAEPALAPPASLSAAQGGREGAVSAPLPRLAEPLAAHIDRIHEELGEGEGVTALLHRCALRQDGMLCVAEGEDEEGGGEGEGALLPASHLASLKLGPRQGGGGGGGGVAHTGKGEQGRGGSASLGEAAGPGAGSEEAGSSPLSPTTLSRHQVFGASLDWVESLCEASNSLASISQEERHRALRLALEDINIELEQAALRGVAVWFPMGGRNERVLRIAAKEAVLLNSREKAPFMLFVEVLESSSRPEPPSVPPHPPLPHRGQAPVPPSLPPTPAPPPGPPPLALPAPAPDPNPVLRGGGVDPKGLEAAGPLPAALEATPPDWAAAGAAAAAMETAVSLSLPAAKPAGSEPPAAMTQAEQQQQQQEEEEEEGGWCPPQGLQPATQPTLFTFSAPAVDPGLGASRTRTPTPSQLQPTSSPPSPSPRLTPSPSPSPSPVLLLPVSTSSGPASQLTDSLLTSLPLPSLGHAHHPAPNHRFTASTPTSPHTRPNHTPWYNQPAQLTITSACTSPRSRHPALPPTSPHTGLPTSRSPSSPALNTACTALGGPPVPDHPPPSHTLPAAPPKPPPVLSLLSPIVGELHQLEAGSGTLPASHCALLTTRSATVSPQPQAPPLLHHLACPTPAWRHAPDPWKQPQPLPLPHDPPPHIPCQANVGGPDQASPPTPPLHASLDPTPLSPPAHPTTQGPSPPHAPNPLAGYTSPPQQPGRQALSSPLPPLPLPLPLAGQGTGPRPLAAAGAEPAPGAPSLVFIPQRRRQTVDCRPGDGPAPRTSLHLLTASSSSSSLAGRAGLSRTPSQSMADAALNSIASAAEEAQAAQATDPAAPGQQQRGSSSNMWGAASASGQAAGAPDPLPLSGRLSAGAAGAGQAWMSHSRANSTPGAPPSAAALDPGPPHPLHYLMQTSSSGASSSRCGRPPPSLSATSGSCADLASLGGGATQPAPSSPGSTASSVGRVLGGGGSSGLAQVLHAWLFPGPDGTQPGPDDDPGQHLVTKQSCKAEPCQTPCLGCGTGTGPGPGPVVDQVPAALGKVEPPLPPSPSPFAPSLGTRAETAAAPAAPLQGAGLGAPALPYPTPLHPGRPPLPSPSTPPPHKASASSNPHHHSTSTSPGQRQQQQQQQAQQVSSRVASLGPLGAGRGVGGHSLLMGQMAGAMASLRGEAPLVRLRLRIHDPPLALRRPPGPSASPAPGPPLPHSPSSNTYAPSPSTHTHHAVTTGSPAPRTALPASSAFRDSYPAAAAAAAAAASHPAHQSGGVSSNHHSPATTSAPPPAAPPTPQPSLPPGNSQEPASLLTAGSAKAKSLLSKIGICRRPALNTGSDDEPEEGSGTMVQPTYHLKYVSVGIEIAGGINLSITSPYRKSRRMPSHEAITMVASKLKLQHAAPPADMGPPLPGRVSWAGPGGGDAEEEEESEGLSEGEGEGQEGLGAGYAGDGVGPQGLGSSGWGVQGGGGKGGAGGGSAWGWPRLGGAGGGSSSSGGGGGGGGSGATLTLPSTSRSKPSHTHPQQQRQQQQQQQANGDGSKRSHYHSVLPVKLTQPPALPPAVPLKPASYPSHPPPSSPSLRPSGTASLGNITPSVTPTHPSSSHPLPPPLGSLPPCQQAEKQMVASVPQPPLIATPTGQPYTAASKWPGPGFDPGTSGQPARQPSTGLGPFSGSSRPPASCAAALPPRALPAACSAAPAGLIRPGSRPAPPSAAAAAANSGAGPGSGGCPLQLPPPCSLKLDRATEKRRKEAWAVYGERLQQKAARVKAEAPLGHLPGWAMRCVIVKSGDDCRQELLAVQLIHTFDDIFQEASLPLWLRPYNVLVTSNRTAMIEVVPDALSIHTVKHRSPPGASLSDHFFAKWPRGTPECLTAQRNFTESLAAYSIVCYFLQIKDRHNGNVLIDDQGHIVHIDFGFMLSNSPGGVNFEAAPFKLTRELLEVMDSNSEGQPSELFDYFKVLIIQGFLACRKHHDRLLLLVRMMSKSGLPCFKAGDRAVKAMEKRFALQLTEVQSVQMVLGLISDSLDAWRTRQYDYYQRLLNGIL